ncbi:hypothetical protein CANARDRAFT_177022 [[Candida] arabinofermentans NRRL YB-2248]|uniref:RING-CH-type domain-containing protein n=1 Tax=[Candida] arabinofermentans NRRL YB-2248 TaxID=983967 RepID=A0A1E4SXB4_9ASCO|nr:hypothetical protein CANARDRAFT_177022 [[Candida] arabinofermentans NRRL YB-2248]
MQSLPSEPPSLDSTCYICLMGHGELAPLCNKLESQDFIKPCQCSFLVHRKCFISWVSSVIIQNGNGRNFDTDQQQQQQVQQLQEQQVRQQVETQVPLQPAGNGNPEEQTYFVAVVGRILALTMRIPSLTTPVSPQQQQQFTTPPTTTTDEQPTPPSPSPTPIPTPTPSPTLRNIKVAVTQCPQCKRRIILSSPTSKSVNFQTQLDQIITEAAKTITLSTTYCSIGAIVTSLVIAGVGSVGLGVLNIIAPINVQMSLFDTGLSTSGGGRGLLYRGGLGILNGFRGVNVGSNGLISNGNLSNDGIIMNLVERGVLPMSRFYGVTCSVALYLFYLRHGDYFDNNFIKIAFRMLPFIISGVGLRENDDFITSGGKSPFLKLSATKKIILLTLPLRGIYKLFYNLGLNRIYYKWCKKVQPCLIADSLSFKELERMEKETEEDYEADLIAQEKRRNEMKQENNGNKLINLMQKLIRIILPKLSISNLKRLKREIINCFKTNYGLVFRKTNIFLYISTTLTWPIAGRIISSFLLSKIPQMNGFLNKFTDTPDEGEFLRNIIGCCLVVLLKDGVNLYFNYCRYCQLRDMDVVKM